MDNQNFTPLKAGEKRSIKEVKTVLHFQVKNDCVLVKVDGGIITATVKKCDYLLQDEINLLTHLIELKGSVIDAAFEQLSATVDNISASDYRYLLEGLKTLDAYIVSPCRRTSPCNVNSKERMLAKKLYSKCSVKPNGMSDLIHYVKAAEHKKNRLWCDKYVGRHSRHIYLVSIKLIVIYSGFIVCIDFSCHIPTTISAF